MRHKFEDQNYLNLKVVQRKGLGEQKSFSKLIHDIVGWKLQLCTSGADLFCTLGKEKKKQKATLE